MHSYLSITSVYSILRTLLYTTSAECVGVAYHRGVLVVAPRALSVLVFSPSKFLNIQRNILLSMIQQVLLVSFSWGLIPISSLYETLACATSPF